MVSSRTINRLRKVEMLKECLNGILDLLLMDHKSRDMLNMAEYKDLCRKVKWMAETGKLLQKNLLPVGKKTK